MLLYDDNYIHILMSLVSFINKRSLHTKGIKKILKCVDETAGKSNNSGLVTAIHLNKQKDTVGILHTYRHYAATNKIEVVDGTVLREYGKDGYETSDLTEKRIWAETVFQNMTVGVTGVRPGETIIGTHNISRNALLRVSDGIIPLSKVDVEAMLYFPDIWEEYIERLSAIPFFSNMENEERQIWILDHLRDGEFDLTEGGSDVYVNIVDVGKSNFRKLEENVVTELLTGNAERDDGSWNIKDVRNKFPGKPGSRARRHTLIFLYHLWKISTTSSRVTDTTDVIYDIENNKMLRGGEGDFFLLTGIPKDESEKQNICIPYSVSRPIDYDTLLCKKFNKKVKDIERVQNVCSAYTPAGYKSLLQKIIRFRPKYVDCGEYGKIEADFCLCVVFTLLLKSPGSFVPDIQRFVSGQESAFKRLAVSIFEDSYLEDFSLLQKLLIMALLTQRINSWKPSKEIYLQCLDICVKSLETAHAFEWDLEKGDYTTYYFSIKNKPLANCAALLEEIRSFEWDIRMVQDIATSKGKYISKVIDTRPEVMPVYHNIDFHWAPELVYFLPLTLIEKYAENSAKPFRKIFREIFHRVTGVNARKTFIDLEKFENNSFVKHIRLAQRLTDLSKKTGNEEKLDETSKSYFLKTTLDISWIAGLVGTLDFSGSPPAMVTLRPDDPLQLVAIRKPSRGMKNGILPDDRIEEVLEKAKQLLTNKGVGLTAAQAPLPEMGKYRAYLRDNEYIFTCGDITKSWEEFRDINLKLCYHPTEEFSYDKVLTTSGNGLRKNAFSTFEEILKVTDVTILRRLYTYINSYRSLIEVARLSKDGGGTLQTVLTEDIGACQLLLHICFLFPGALERELGRVSKFKVKVAPLLWEVRDLVRKYLTSVSEDNEQSGKWKIIKDKTRRIPRTYQVDTLDEMIEKNKQNKKGHFLWIPTGMGKTLIVLSYLEHLRKSTMLPKYVIYTLPKSALKSIITEIEFFGLPINLLIPIKSWKKHPLAEKYTISNNEVIEYHINIIEHDHLRLLEEELITYIQDSVFIIDEVHKALNDTKRTSTALELSKLSYEFVAMTGTPIVDSNTYKLIWWLEQIVDFDVNDKNFWVAANGMIAKKVNTGVLVDKRDIIAPMSKSTREIYKKLVSSTLGGTNQRPSQSDIRKAFEVCYESCDDEMIKQTLEFLKEKRWVMLVVRNSKHQEVMRQKLLEEGVKDRDIFVLTKDKSIFLTDEVVEAGDAPAYKVALVPLNKSEGYTLTRMSVMITSVYPSNQATREQLEGRINRLSQHAKEISYRVIHNGILTYVMQKHQNAASISAVLSALAVEV